jgi:hypothetical protein
MQSSNKRLSINIQILNNNKIKKVDYGDGEYEKELKRWKPSLINLYEKVTENMNLSVEKIVQQNYIQFGKEYSALWEELMKIEPTNKYKLIHENLIMEAKNGAMLSNSYINDIKRFDSIFKDYFIYHYKNTK